jgi:hypothetical protein
VSALPTPGQCHGPAVPWTGAGGGHILAASALIDHWGWAVNKGLRFVGALAAAGAVALSALGSQVGVMAATPSATLAGAVGAVPAFQRGTRHTQPVTSGSARAEATPAGVQAATANAGSSHLLANFDGVGSLDSAITNFGAEFEPPDQGLCAGNGYVVEMVNSAFRVYDTSGHTLAGPTNVNAPFHDGSKQFTSDPRCQYDASTNTWFAVVLFLNNPFTASRIDIAVNTSGDPRTSWSVFHIGTTDAKAPASEGCPCFGDQPTLGIDAFNLYTTTNEFSILGPQFNGAQIYAISKRDLIHHAANVHFVHYKNLTIAGSLAASIQPALTNGWAPAEYFLSSLDPNGTGDHRIGVWALTNVSAVDAGGMPKLSSMVIRSEPYAIPPPAAQMGSTSTLDSGDDRMQQTQFIDGEIWGALDTQVTPAGDTMPRAGVAWFRVRPRLEGSSLGWAELTGQGYVASAGEYVLYPAIEADAEGHAAMVVSVSGANRFASAAYSVLGRGGSQFGAPVIAAAGSGPYDPAATRWGDYSSAVLDPRSDSVWMATEYMPPLSSQTADGLRNWGTRVLHLALG